MLSGMPERHTDGGPTVPPLLSVCAAELLERAMTSLTSWSARSPARSLLCRVERGGPGRRTGLQRAQSVRAADVRGRPPPDAHGCRRAVRSPSGHAGHSARRGAGPYVRGVAERNVTAMEQALLRNGLRSAWSPRPDGLAGIVALPDPALASGSSRVPGTALVREVVGAVVMGACGSQPCVPAVARERRRLRLVTVAKASLPAGTHRAVTLDHDRAAALVASGHDLALRPGSALLEPVLAAPDRKDLMETLSAWLDSESGSPTEIAGAAPCSGRRTSPRSTPRCGLSSSARPEAPPAAVRLTPRQPTTAVVVKRSPQTCRREVRSVMASLEPGG